MDTVKGLWVGRLGGLCYLIPTSIQNFILFLPVFIDTLEQALQLIIQLLLNLRSIANPYEANRSLIIYKEKRREIIDLVSFLDYKEAVNQDGDSSFRKEFFK